MELMKPESDLDREDKCREMEGEQEVNGMPTLCTNRPGAK